MAAFDSKKLDRDNRVKFDHPPFEVVLDDPSYDRVNAFLYSSVQAAAENRAATEERDRRLDETAVTDYEQLFVELQAEQKERDRKAYERYSDLTGGQIPADVLAELPAPIWAAFTEWINSDFLGR